MPWTFGDPGYGYASLHLHFEKDVVSESSSGDNVAPSICNQYYAACICDPFLKALPLVPICKKSKNFVKDMMSSFLEDHATCVGDMTEAQKAASEIIVQVYLGLMAMISHVPGIYGCKPQHVAYVFPPNGTRAEIMSDLPRLGRVTVNKLRGEPWWGQQTLGYEKMAAQDEDIRTRLKALVLFCCLYLDCMCGGVQTVANNNLKRFFNSSSSCVQDSLKTLI